MNFKEFLCEWFDECIEFKDKDVFLDENHKPETTTQDI
jgi:hypothetical protein